LHHPLVISMGDPTGVGPEIILQALQSAELSIDHPLLIAGDLGVLRRAASVLNLPFEAREHATGLATHEIRVGKASCLLCNLTELPADSLRYGRPTRACGEAMVRYIEWGLARCQSGEAAALVTCPINKAAVREAGFDFPGHTELLAERCDVEKVVMMLAGPRLRVALVTTHLALSQVPAALSAAEILETIRITDRSLKDWFGMERPRLAVLALNPHAGEGGHFGDEEARLILPAIERAKAEGIAASGPHSADTLFHFALQGHFDAVICMYHDQGLIPLKMLHFEDGINLTLGLPVVRTSVDHGTAYDLAGTGRADCRSLLEAIRQADRMARCREGRS